MKRKKTKLIEEEPLLEEGPVRQENVRSKRVFWIIGLAVAGIVGLFFALNKNGEKAPGVEVVSQGGNSPDAVIEDFHLVSTVQGERHWEMYSNKARLYQNQKEAYADNITCQYYKKGKIASTLTADQAQINTETNATLAEGHVELIVENGSKLETEKLSWDQDTDQIKTDGRVHIYKGADEITAIGLVADTQLNNIQFMKDVKTQVRDTHEVETFSEPKKF